MTVKIAPPPVTVDPQGNLLEVPFEHVTDAFNAGKLGFAKGSKIPVITPAGDAATVDSSQLHAALDEGARLESPQEQQARLQKVEYAGQGTRASVEAFLRGATMNASDVAFKALGVPKEDILGREEAHPGKVAMAELAGIAGPAIVTAGGSLLEKVGLETAGAGLKAAARGLPIGWVEEAGSAVSKAAGTALEGRMGKSLSQRIVAKALETGAGSAVVGAAMGGASKVSEDIFNDHDLSAEAVLAHAGLGAIIGGGLGGVLGAGEVAVPQALKAAARASEKLDEKLAPAKAFLQEKAADASAWVSGKDRDTILKFMQDPKAKSIASMSEKELDTHAEELYGALQKSIDEVKAAEVKTNKLNRPEEIQKLLKGVDSGPMKGEAVNLLGQMKAEVDKMRLNDNTYVKAAQIDKADRAILSTAQDLRKAKTGGRVFEIMDDFKKKWGGADVADFGANVQRSDLSYETYEKLRDMYRPLREHLENETVYGAMAARQAALNEARSGYIDVFQKEFGRGAAAEVKSFGRMEADAAGHKQFIFELPKLRTFLKKAGKEEAAEAFEWFTDMHAKQKSYIEQMAETAKNSTKGIDAEKLMTLREAAEAKAKDTVETYKLANEYKKLKGSSYGDQEALATGGAAAAAHMLGLPGAPAAIAYNAFHTLRSPADMLARLRFIETARDKVGKVMEKAVEGFLGAAVSKASQKVLPRAAVQTMSRDRFEEDSKRITKNMPAHVQESVAKGLDPFARSAPKTAAALIQKSLGAQQMLYAKLPKKPMLGNLLNPELSKWRPSDHELSKFNRYRSAIEDPMGVFHDIAAGKVSVEQIDSLRQAYPKLYGELVRKVTDKIADLGDDIPYKKRLRLGILLNVPTDSALDPGFIQRLQAGHAEEAAKEGAKKVEFSRAQSLQSQTERTINRT